MTDVLENHVSGYGQRLNINLSQIAAQHPLLTALDEKSLETVMSMSRLTVYRPKRTVQRAGDPPRHVHLLISGTVRVFCRNEASEELTLELLSGPAIFNDARVLADSDAEEQVLTLDRCTVLSIPGELFRRLVSLRPQFAEVLLRDQASRACQASAQKQRLAFDDIDTRLANLLIDYAHLIGVVTDSGNVRLTLALSQQSMANDLGASRKSLNRALERLREIGAVTKSDARYEITNLAAIVARSSCKRGIRHSIDESVVGRLKTNGSKRLE
ncbi:MAG: Crp/Fnr family transcriptional regulator [Myxococcota bacterium]